MNRPPTYVTLARMDRTLAELDARLAGHPDERTLRLLADLRSMLTDVQANQGGSG